mmetsp:Transcript_19891/g.36701  ORF Transcript_19891/g.36701 Transcript_19891/m.36701 type:complete len:188 (-) Transcript_19891:5401-5964(-)
MKTLVSTALGRKKLDEIVKLKKLLKETPAKIEDVWNTYHGAFEDQVSCVLSASQYTLFKKRSATHPYFMFVVSRNNQTFNLASVAKTSFNTFHLDTDLVKNPNYAKVYMCIDTYEDLLTTKLVAPVHADFDTSLLSKAEAEFLMRSFFFFYSEDKHFEFVDQYSKGKLEAEAYLEAMLKLQRVSYES